MSSMAAAESSLVVAAILTVRRYQDPGDGCDAHDQLPSVVASGGASRVETGDRVLGDGGVWSSRGGLESATDRQRACLYRGSGMVAFKRCGWGDATARRSVYDVAPGLEVLIVAPACSGGVEAPSCEFSGSHWVRRQDYPGDQQSLVGTSEWG